MPSAGQVIWKPVETPLAHPTPEIWETTISDPEKQDEATVKWEAVNGLKGPNLPPSIVIWDVLENNDDLLIPPSKIKSNPRLFPPNNLEEAEALLDTIPLQSRISNHYSIFHTPPTASVLSQEEWLYTSTISPSGMQVDWQSKSFNPTRL